MLRLGPLLAATAILVLPPALTPSSAASQTVHIVHLPVGQEVGQQILESRRFRFEPWGGVLFDAYRNAGGDGRPAWIGAVRMGYELGPGYASDRGWRLVAEMARAEAAEAGTAVVGDSLTVVFRTEWWLGTAGVEWDALGGWTGLTAEVRAGAAWLQREIVGGDSIAPGTPGTRQRAGHDRVPAVVFGVSGYRHLTHRVQVRLRLADVVTDPVEAMEHSPLIGVGFRFVFE